MAKFFFLSLYLCLEQRLIWIYILHINHAAICMCNTLKCWFKHPLPYLPFRKPLVCFIDIKLECHLLLLHSYCCCLPDPPFSVLGLRILLKIWSFLQTTFKLVASCKHLWMWSNVNAIGKLSNFKWKLAARGESYKNRRGEKSKTLLIIMPPSP